jgi:hypothetical protein
MSVCDRASRCSAATSSVLGIFNFSESNKENYVFENIYVISKPTEEEPGGKALGNKTIECRPSIRLPDQWNFFMVTSNVNL